MIESFDNTPVEPPRVVRVYQSIRHAIQENDRNKQDAFAGLIGTRKIRHQEKLNFEAKTWASSVLDSKPQDSGANA